MSKPTHAQRKPDDAQPSTPTPAVSAPAAAFEIYLAWSDVTVPVASGESALHALLAAGYPVSPGCQTGACGECVTAYVEGDLIHKDSCLNADDRQHQFCPCVSRAKSRIVIAG